MQSIAKKCFVNTSLNLKLATCIHVHIASYTGISNITFVTRQEKTMLIVNMYTKYISSLYVNYLTFCVSYTSSVNYIGFPIVSCTIGKSFTETLLYILRQKVQILCAPHEHCFLMPGHICDRILKNLSKCHTRPIFHLLYL